MDAKLTTTQRGNSDFRIACSDYHKGSITPPNGPGCGIIRERSSEHLRSEDFDRRRSSRQVQEGRPNRSGRVSPNPETKTCRRPSPYPSGSKRLDSKTYGSCRSLYERPRHPRRSPVLGPEAMAGVLREIPAAKLPRLGNRIYGSSVQASLGGGDRD